MKLLEVHYYKEGVTLINFCFRLEYFFVIEINFSENKENLAGYMAQSQ